MSLAVPQLNTELTPSLDIEQLQPEVLTSNKQEAVQLYTFSVWGSASALSFSLLIEALLPVLS